MVLYPLQIPIRTKDRQHNFVENKSKFYEKKIKSHRMYLLNRIVNNRYVKKAVRTKTSHRKSFRILQ